MLPPLRASSSSSSSFQNQSSATAPSPAAVGASYAGLLADSDSEVNANIAGRLNIMILAGGGRMAENLSMLAEALGRAIGLPREDGEQSVDYALRLVEALPTLTPARRADVERQLNLLVQGLKLRMLMEALNNPTGPVAARIVAYLETVRYKDRDLAARSVVTSYRQNEGSAGPLPGSGRPLASTGNSPSAPAAAANTGGAAVQASLAQTSSTIFDALPSHPEEAETFVAVDTSAGGLPETEAAQHATPGSKTLPAAEMDDIAAQAGADVVETLDLTADTEAMVADMADPELTPADARSLQDILKKAFEAGDSGDPSIEDKATAEMLRDGLQSEGLDEAPPQPSRNAAVPKAVSSQQSDARLMTDSADDAAPAETRPQSAAEAARSRDAAGMPARTTDYRSTLFILKGWAEVATAAEIGLQELIQAPVEAEILLEPRRPGERPAPFVGMIAAEAEHSMPSLPLDTRPAGTANSGDSAEQPAASDPLDDATRQTRPVATGSEPAAVRSSDVDNPAPVVPVLPMREGIPYMVVNYLPAQDMLAPDVDEANPWADDADEDEDEAGGDEPDTGDTENEPDETEMTAEAANDDDPQDIPAAFAEETEADRAYGLYQRMAGWS